METSNVFKKSVFFLTFLLTVKCATAQIQLKTCKLELPDGIMQIGNVTTPIGYGLYVEKGILTEKIRIAKKEGLNWADYVFSDSYQLLSLPKLEQFIQQHKHLPNMPSATDIDSEGLDVSAVLTKQMEKIEELTLYIIELNKQLETLKQQVLTLQTNKK